MIRIFNQYVSTKGILLFIFESLLIVAALVAAVWLRFWWDPAEFGTAIGSDAFPWQVLLILTVFQICFCYGDVYGTESIQNPGDLLACLAQSIGGACLLLSTVFFLFPSMLIGRGIFLMGTALMAVFIFVARALLNQAWKAAALGQNTLILGTGKLAWEVAAELGRRPDLGVKVIGCLRAESERDGCDTGPDGMTCGTVDELESVAARERIDKIVVALEERRGSLPISALMRLRGGGIQIEDAHTTLAALTGRVSLATVQPSWFVFAEGYRRSGFVMTIKRSIDLALAIFGFVLSVPLMALVALAIMIDTGLPLLYRQTRVGLKGKHFELLKFRSMTCDAEKGIGAQWATPNDPRVTRVGRFIRKYRLDELPQFINIIRGEMSFVGPRPERPVFVDQLRTDTPYYDERHRVRPGLTGWAQVRYTYTSTSESALRKLEYDLFYLKNMSPVLDCIIVAQTIRIISTGQGAL